MTPFIPSKWRHCRLVGGELVTGRMFPLGFEGSIMKVTHCLRPSLKLGDWTFTVALGGGPQWGVSGSPDSQNAT